MKRTSGVSKKAVKKVKFETPNVPEDSNFEDFVIAKTSTEPVTVNTGKSGSYFILVSDTNADRGAHSVFVGTRTNASGKGTISRLSSSRGTEEQRIDADWLEGEEFKIYHKPAGSGRGNYTYRVKIYSAL